MRARLLLATAVDIVRTTRANGVEDDTRAGLGVLVLLLGGGP